MDFRVLGPLDVSDSAESKAMGGPKQRAVLALLIAGIGHPTPAERIIEAVWSESGSARARASLHTYISNLRAELGDVINRGPNGYVLDISPESVDAYEFERLSRRGADLVHESPHDASVVLHEALSLWRGEPYEDLSDCGNLHAEIARLNELKIATTRARFDVDLMLGRHVELIGELEVLSSAHPFEESLRAQHMLALYRSGRQAEALRVYDKTRRFLADELGIEPGAELQLLEAKILRQDGSLELRLGGRSDFAISATAAQLPHPLTSVVGRDAEVDHISELLESSRLVTITGLGGIGKTRVALEVAHRAGKVFTGGVRWAELAPVRKRIDVHAVVAAALGVRPNPGSDFVASMVSGIGDRDLLLVLDNCEHVLDDGFELANKILAQCPNACLVATSREPLGVEGETIVPLRPLEHEHADDRRRAPAVELFIDRAVAAGAGTSVAGDSHDAIVEICRRLDGLPLAIELAAGLARSLTPAEILEGLDAGFQLLVGTRGRVDRHRTLRTTLMWSYDLLDETAQDLLLWLAVFAGSFTADDLERVTGLSRIAAVSGLRDLVDKSWVVAEPAEGRTGYRLLETVREFAAEELEATGMAADRRTVHAWVAADLAQELGERSRGPHEAEAVRAGIGLLESFREAFRWAEASGNTEVALILVTELWDIAKWTGTYEVLGWADAALTMPGSSETGRGATAVAISAENAVMRGELETAEQNASAALEMDPPPHRPSLAHYVLQGAARFRGDFAAARSRSETMVTVARETQFLPDAFGAQALLIDAMDAGSQRSRALDELLVESRAFGNIAGLWLPHTFHALALMDRGDLAALRELRALVDLSHSCRYRLLELRARRNACYAEAVLGNDLVQPLQELVGQLGLLQGTDEIVDVTSTLGLIGYVSSRMGRWEPAARLAGFVNANSAILGEKELDYFEAELRGAVQDGQLDAFERARAAGLTMTVDEAIAVARSIPGIDA